MAKFSSLASISAFILWWLLMSKSTPETSLYRRYITSQTLNKIHEMKANSENLMTRHHDSRQSVTHEVDQTYLGFSCVFICLMMSSIQRMRSRTMLKNLNRSWASASLMRRELTIRFRFFQALTTSASRSWISPFLSPA